MNFKYSIDTEMKFIFCSWQGSFDLESANSALDRMYSDQDYQAAFDGICDTSEADFVFDADDIRQHHEFIHNHPIGTTGHWAVITTEPHITALTMLYGRLSEEKHTTQAFTTLEAAQEWLSNERGHVFEDSNS